MFASSYGFARRAALHTGLETVGARSTSETNKCDNVSKQIGVHNCYTGI